MNIAIQIIIVLIFITTVLNFSQNEKVNLKFTSARETYRISFPYLASIQAPANEEFTEFTHVCSGAIIRNSWIITSFYCTSIFPRRSRVATGLFKGLSPHLYSFQTTEIDLIIDHPLRARGRSAVESSDISLLKLKNSLVWSRFIQPIALPLPNDINYHLAIAVRLEGNDSLQNSIIYTDVKNVEMTECLKIVKEGRSSLTIKSSQVDSLVCVKKRNEETICPTDFGSILVKHGFLIGIMSWIIDPCDSEDDIPLLYSRVDHVSNWILDQIVKN